MLFLGHKLISISNQDNKFGLIELINQHSLPQNNNITYNFQVT